MSCRRDGSITSKIRQTVLDIAEKKKQFTTKDVVTAMIKSGDDIVNYGTLYTSVTRVMNEFVKNGNLTVEKRTANGTKVNFYKSQKTAPAQENTVPKTTMIQMQRILANLDALNERGEKIQIENAKISEWLYGIEVSLRNIEKSMGIMQAQMSKAGSKPKATSPSSVEEKKKVELRDDLGGNELYEITSKNAMRLGEEEYTRNIDIMIKYIVGRTEGSTAKQIKSNFYKEMHREYGYSDSDERRRFLARNGRAANSGIELMYDNMEFKAIYYNKVADRVSKLYGL